MMETAVQFTIFARLVLLAALACSTAVATAQTSAPAMAPIAAFFDRANYTDAELSPDGQYLAMRIVDKNGHDALGVVTLATLAATVAASYASDDIRQFQWVNNERLVYTLGNKEQAEGDRWTVPGLFAVNRDGTKMVQLAERTGSQRREASTFPKKILPWHTYLMARGAQDSDAIYVISPEWDDAGYGKNIMYVNLLRLDTVTGKSETVRRPGAVRGWLLDQKGTPRIAITLDQERETIYYLDPATDAWRNVASFDAYLDGPGGIHPVGFGADGALYVTSRIAGDTLSLHRFNLATGKVNPEPVLTAPGYDVTGHLIRNRDKLLGMTMITDAHSVAWFDPGMQAVQKLVDQALPGLVNLVTPAADPAATHVLVASFSDRTPMRYALFNTKTGQVNPVGNSRPAIDPNLMGRQEIISYQARDGMAIPAKLTLPPGGTGKNLPLVVLVHDSPFSRGPAWGWSAESQFLATRGYAVLEPQYRGNSGLGYKHFSAGFKQWGLAMQDDIADGARWAIAQGVANAGRVCIAGAGYGGYAALMGLVNDPTLYKCGIDWAGFTDIRLIYRDTLFSESSISDDYKKYGMPRLVGDLVKDAAALSATSPIEQASRIKQPLLLAYGGADDQVPMVQGKLFYEKVTKTNSAVEWIEYGNEGHGWELPENKIDFWTRVEKFLDKNIGTP